MSSSSTCFQPPVHNVAQIYGHRETESQQSYSNNHFNSANYQPDVDTDSYARTDLYDQAGYSHVPSTPGSAQFENSEEALRYGHMQGEDLNSLASPQLLCPRPTLPSSQLSWYDWPSDAPANGYQVYFEQNTSRPERYTTTVPHSPQVPEIQQHSFESQQFVHKYYSTAEEFGETICSPLSPNHLGDTGYHQQPFLASLSPFDRNSIHSTHNQPRYYAAHQPVPPEQRSSYSELAPNLKFMNTHSQSPPIRQESTKISQDSSFSKRKAEMINRSATPSLDVTKNPFALGLNGPPLTAIGRKVPLPGPIPLPPYPTSNSSPSSCASVPVNNTTIPTTPPTSSPTSTSTPPPTTKGSNKTGKARSSRSVNEPRRPSLACTFCRERKIACGRPPDESPDPTCKCRYLDLKSTSRASTSSKGLSSLKRK